RGNLVERRGRAVIIDADTVEQRQVGAPGTHLGQLALERVVRLGDTRLEILHYVVHHGRFSSSVTSVPIDSPATTRRMLPRVCKSNTTIASLLSRQSAVAVESITFKFCCRTSR